MNWRKQKNEISFVTSNNMRFLLILQHKINLRKCVICQIFLDFYPRDEGPNCLKGACGCVSQPSFSRKWGAGKLNQTDG